jgi:hypothetical protein
MTIARAAHLRETDCVIIYKAKGWAGPSCAPAPTPGATPPPIEGAPQVWGLQIIMIEDFGNSSRSSNE